MQFHSKVITASMAYSKLKSQFVITKPLVTWKYSSVFRSYELIRLIIVFSKPAHALMMTVAGM